MAIGVLILGESGTGKTYSVKTFSPDEVKILSVVKPILPFRGKYEVVKTPDAESIILEMKNTKKKNIVIDDFQYILGVPMMRRIGEKGWDKFNDIQQPYADVLDALNTLPDDTIVYLNSHTEQDDTGKRKIKTIGKALDKYLTVEGLFMIVLGTMVVDGKYYFQTQNGGNDTLKSPEGMFPTLLIPNDLKYVEDKIRSYYFMDGAKSDAEMEAEDQSHAVTDVMPKKGRSRGQKKEEPKEDPVQTAAEKIADGRDAVPFDEAVKAADAPAQTTDAPAQDAEPEKRERKARSVEPSNVCQQDSYFHIISTDNYVMVHAGDPIPEGAEQVTKEQFVEGAKRIAVESAPPVPAELTAPTTRRRRR
jgi:hypothetical protein